MVTEVATALIAAGTSLTISLYQAIQGQRNQRELEALKSRLSDQQAERDARRGYEYKALQRLYEEYEPLRFRLLEAVESAKHQIEDLGYQEVVRQQGIEGILPGGNYLLRATIYHLLLPATVYRIISRSLTLVDLRLDPQIEMEYLLAKKSFLVLSDDARIARLTGLAYTPYVDGWRDHRKGNAQKFRRQGLPPGRLDNAVEALIAPLASISKHERVISFGEFEEKVKAVEESDVRSALGAARDLFFDFHPIRRPVLWRILLVQYLLYKAILHSARVESGTVSWLLDPKQSLTPGELDSLRWGTRDTDTSDDVSLEGALRGVKQYIRDTVIPDVRRIEQHATRPSGLTRGADTR